MKRVSEGRRREPSIKTLCSLLSAELFKTQRRAFALVPEVNNLFPRVGIEPTTVAIQSHTCVQASRRPHYNI